MNADPHGVESIAGALRTGHEDGVRYWQSITTPEFLSPLGSGWSPADHVRHLTKSIRAVSSALRLPRLLLRLAFGRGPGHSRPHAEVRERYLARLAQGGGAGRFAPTPLRDAADPERARSRVMASHADAVASLVTDTLQWPDEALDRHCMPHPLLGRLTVREMLLFTVYHNAHHVGVVQRKRDG